MRYIVDIPRRQDIKIKEILAGNSGGYSSVEEFILVACENQIKLEETPVGSKSTESKIAASAEIEECDTSLRTTDFSGTATVDMPGPEKVKTIVLWGQVYRVFPIKLGARVLANMLKEGNVSYIGLDEFRESAADAARSCGLKLKQLDEQHNRKPGSKFATGLPTGSNPESSMNMYKSQYLAYQTDKGDLVGALADLRLVNIDGDMIGITEKGLKFAEISNPFLDSEGSSPNNILSVEEAEYYISLVDEFLPKEAEFMRFILKSLENGEPHRGEFNESVKKLVEGYWNREITTDMANTIRYGALSRMWELGLVENKRIGRRVIYSITDKGVQYRGN
jgi:hypothetical protein